jgi:hypothetical protein
MPILSGTLIGRPTRATSQPPDPRLCGRAVFARASRCSAAETRALTIPYPLLLSMHCAALARGFVQRRILRDQDASRFSFFHDGRLAICALRDDLFFERARIYLQCRDRTLHIVERECLFLHESSGGHRPAYRIRRSNAFVCLQLTHLTRSATRTDLCVIGSMLTIDPPPRGSYFPGNRWRNRTLLLLCGPASRVGIVLRQCRVRHTSLEELTVDCWRLTVRRDHQLRLSTVNRQLSTLPLSKRHCR